MVVNIAYLEKSKKASMSDCKNRETCKRLLWKGSYGPYPVGLVCFMVFGSYFLQTEEIGIVTHLLYIF